MYACTHENNSCMHFEGIECVVTLHLQYVLWAVYLIPMCDSHMYDYFVAYRYFKCIPIFEALYR